MLVELDMAVPVRSYMSPKAAASAFAGFRFLQQQRRAIAMHTQATTNPPPMQTISMNIGVDFSSPLPLLLSASGVVPGAVPDAVPGTVALSPTTARNDVVGSALMVVVARVVPTGESDCHAGVDVTSAPAPVGTVIPGLPAAAAPAVLATVADTDDVAVEATTPMVVAVNGDVIVLRCVLVVVSASVCVVRVVGGAVLRVVRVVLVMEVVVVVMLVVVVVVGQRPSPGMQSG